MNAPTSPCSDDLGELYQRCQMLIAVAEDCKTEVDQMIDTQGHSATEPMFDLGVILADLRHTALMARSIVSRLYAGPDRT